MYQQSYLEMAEDSREITRERERLSFARTIRTMENADAEPDNASLRAQALHETNRLWSFLLEDLASRENLLDRELRANLISIGIYVLRQCQLLRHDGNLGFGGIIDISRTLEKGLE